MKILVLGNGFDIDHDLPTSYVAFMRFCKSIVTGNDSELDDNQKLYLKVLSHNRALKKHFLKLLQNNCFFNYFLQRIDELGPDWIDLEREIKSVVHEFRTVERMLKSSNQSHYVVEASDKIYDLIDSLSLEVDLFLNDITLNSIHIKLCEALNDFSCALELYISHFINSTPIVGVSPDIVNYEANKVLVFNYSNTYERIYGGLHWGEEIDYVHGKAVKQENSSTNIILGITTPQYNIKTEELKDEGYVEFEKYFQRITKKTGREYVKWLESCKQSKESLEVAFFGHSLDFSDSDIIKDLIYFEDANIIIFYHSEKSHKQIIANLIQIVGKNDLISMVSGDTPKISLVQQKQHLYEATAGIDIQKDIRDLYKLYMLSHSQINELMERLREKVSNKDKDYFYSQQRVISVLEALRWNEINLFSINEFYEICKLLPYEKNRNGVYKSYEYEEWYDYDPTGESPCSFDTMKLIDQVNAYNEKCYKSDVALIPYMHLKFTDNYDVFEQKILEILAEENPTPIFWKQLQTIISVCTDNENFRKFFREYNYDSLSIYDKVKYKHMQRIYDECCFHMAEYERYIENAIDI